ncbi:hypothetical protein BC832DRAFT_140442 [Gaertneriomyces semiglobifer]|nr:hypothetical protein BC832DRAFT_140442 [Gaertneriomyces semiglobifer]
MLTTMIPDNQQQPKRPTSTSAPSTGFYIREVTETLHKFTSLTGVDIDKEILRNLIELNRLGVPPAAIIDFLRQIHEHRSP